MEFTPLNDRILIEYDAPDEKTKNGIYIPEVSQQRPFVGKIVKIGKTKDGKELPLQIGDKVFYSKGAHGDIKINGKDYLILKFDDIIAKVV